MNRMTETCRCVLRVPGRNIFNFRRESSKVNRWPSLLIVIVQVLLQHSLQLSLTATLKEAISVTQRIH